MRTLTPYETKLCTGAGILDVAYLGAIIGSSAGLGAAIACGMGPLSMIPAGAISGAAVMHCLLPDRTLLGAGTGAVSGAFASMVFDASFAANSASPMICAGVLGAWVALFAYSSFKSLNG